MQLVHCLAGSGVAFGLIFHSLRKRDIQQGLRESQCDMYHSFRSNIAGALSQHTPIDFRMAGHDGAMSAIHIKRSQKFFAP